MFLKESVFCKLFPWLSKMAIYLLYGFINYFYQQARWLKGRNKMFLDEKKLRFVLSDYIFKRRESSLILIIQWNLLTFQCDVGCIPTASLFMACKERYNSWMNRALLDRESLDYVSWTSISPLMHLSRISHNLSVAIAKKPATDFLPTEFSIWKMS